LLKSITSMFLIINFAHKGNDFEVKFVMSE